MSIHALETLVADVDGSVRPGVFGAANGRFVEINPPLTLAKVVTASAVHPAGLILSAMRDSRDIQELDVLLGVAEAEAGGTIGKTSILAEFDSAAAFVSGHTLLSEPPARLRALILDPERLAQSLAASTDRPTLPVDSLPIRQAAAQLLLAGAAACLPVLVRLPVTVQDQALVAAFLQRAGDDGFAAVLAHRPTT